MRANDDLMEPVDRYFQLLFHRVVSLLGKASNRAIVGDMVLIAATLAIFGFLLFGLNHALHNYTALGPYFGTQTATFNSIEDTIGRGLLS